MRLTDLLDADVVELGGGTLGHVHDVRLVQDGPPLGSVGATFRISGLIVGGTSFGARLGFARAAVRGPWLLKRLFRRLHADARFVPWSAVRGLTEGRIVIEARADDLRAPDPIG